MRGITSCWGRVWYALQSRENNNATGNIASETVEKSEKDSFPGLGSFTTILARGDNFKCDYSTKTEDDNVQGVAYVDGKTEKLRVEGQGISNGVEGEFGIVVTEDAMYWWGDTPEGVYGMKVPIPEDAESKSEFAAPDASEDSSTPMSMSEEVEYSCAPWKVDDSKFEPPSDIEFVDIGDMFNQMFEGMSEGFERTL